MLNVSDAVDAVLSETHLTPLETVSIENSAGRILAGEILASHDSPPFDKSLMDGFAVASSSFEGQPDDGTIRMEVVATLTAGQQCQLAVSRRTAIRIMTGAILPAGADCVVPIEQTIFDEQNPREVSISRSSVSPEACVLRQGAAAKAGSCLLREGRRISAQQLATLAEFGIDRISVRQRPSVAVLATGNELVSGSQPLRPGQIRNSNEPMLIAQTRQSDGLPVALGIARDDQTELRQRIQTGLQNDILLLTGGVSAGTLDLVPAQLAEAGVRRVFHGIQMKPGKPLWFGVFERDGHRCLVFGLPGNPVSSLVCFELFVRTAIRKMIGYSDPKPQACLAMLDQPIRVGGNRPVYHPVSVRAGRTGLRAEIIPWSGSSDLRATADANAMALLVPEHGPYNTDDRVPVFFWNTELPVDSTR